MYIEQIYTSCLSEASYYVESEGKALVIDPLNDPLNDPVKPPVAVTEPVIVAPPWSTTRPFLTLNSFAIILYCFHQLFYKSQ